MYLKKQDYTFSVGRMLALVIALVAYVDLSAHASEMGQSARIEAIITGYEQDVEWLIDVADGKIRHESVAQIVIDGRSGSVGDKVRARREALALRIAAVEALGKLRSPEAAHCVIRNIRLGDMIVYPEWPDMYDGERAFPGVQAMIHIGMPCAIAILRPESSYLAKPYMEQQSEIKLYAYAIESIFGLYLASAIVVDELHQTTNPTRKENLEHILQYLTPSKQSAIRSSRERWLQLWSVGRNAREGQSEKIENSHSSGADEQDRSR